MKLFKFKSLNKLNELLDVLLNERLYCAPYFELNDPFEGQFILDSKVTIEAVTNEILRLHPEIGQADTIEIAGSHAHFLDTHFGRSDHPVRICSLCGSLNDVRMWAHYGDSHRGVAIEIDFFAGTRMQQPVPVRYEKTLQRLGLLPKSDREIFTQKTLEWGYEEEYRIVQREMFYPVPNQIRAVHCGIRVANETIDLLRKVTLGRLPVLRTQLDKSGIRVVPVATPDALHE